MIRCICKIRTVIYAGVLFFLVMLIPCTNAQMFDRDEKETLIANSNTICTNCKLKCKYSNYSDGYCACVFNICELECWGQSIPECTVSQNFSSCVGSCNYRSACVSCCLDEAINNSQGICRDCYETYKNCFGQNSESCEMNFSNCVYENNCSSIFFLNKCQKF